MSTSYSDSLYNRMAQLRHQPLVSMRDLLLHFPLNLPKFSELSLRWSPLLSTAKLYHSKFCSLSISSPGPCQFFLPEPRNKTVWIDHSCPLGPCNRQLVFLSFRAKHLQINLSENILWIGKYGDWARKITSFFLINSYLDASRHLWWCLKINWEFKLILP